jgi:hypothetical protein
MTTVTVLVPVVERGRVGAGVVSSRTGERIKRGVGWASMSGTKVVDFPASGSVSVLGRSGGEGLVRRVIMLRDTVRIWEGCMLVVAPLDDVGYRDDDIARDRAARLRKDRRICCTL